MSDNDNGQKYHISLNSYDRDCLAFMRKMFGLPSNTSTLRQCLRASAWKLGFKKPPFEVSDDNSTL